STPNNACRMELIPFGRWAEVGHSLSRLRPVGSSVLPLIRGKSQPRFGRRKEGTPEEATNLLKASQGLSNDQGKKHTGMAGAKVQRHPHNPHDPHETVRPRRIISPSNDVSAKRGPRSPRAPVHAWRSWHS